MQKSLSFDLPPLTASMADGPAAAPAAAPAAEPAAEPAAAPAAAPVGEVGPLLTHCTRPVHEDDPPAEIYRFEDDTNWRINRDGVLPSKRLYSRAPFEYYTDPDPLEEDVAGPIDVVFVSTASRDNYITVDKRRCTDEKCPLPHCFPDDRANRPRPIRVSARAERFARLPENVHIQVTQRIISTERAGNLSDETKELDSIPVKPYRFGDAVVDVNMLPYPMTTTGTARLGIVNTREIDVWSATNYWSAAANVLVSTGNMVAANSALSGESETRNQILAWASFLNGIVPDSSVIDGVGEAFRGVANMLSPTKYEVPKKPRAVPNLSSVLNNQRIRTSRAEPTFTKPPKPTGTRVWGTNNKSAAFRLTVSFNEMITQLAAAKEDRRLDAIKAKLTESDETAADLVARLRLRLLALKQTDNVVLLDALLLSRPAPCPRMIGRFVVYQGNVQEWARLTPAQRQDFIAKVSWGVRTDNGGYFRDTTTPPEAPDADPAAPDPTAPGPAAPGPAAPGPARPDLFARSGANVNAMNMRPESPTDATSVKQGMEEDLEEGRPTHLPSMPKLAPTDGWVERTLYSLPNQEPEKVWEYQYKGDDALFIDYSHLYSNKLENSYTELVYKVVGEGAQVELTTTTHASMSAADHYLSTVAEVRTLITVISIFEDLLFEDFDTKPVPNAQSNSWTTSLARWAEVTLPITKRYFGARQTRRILADTSLKTPKAYEANEVLPTGSDLANIALVLSDIKSNFEAIIKPRSDPLKESISVIMADYKMLFPSAWPLKTPRFGRAPPAATDEELEELRVIEETSSEVSEKIKKAYYSLPANHYIPNLDEYQDLFECLTDALKIDLTALALWLREMPSGNSAARRAWQDDKGDLIFEPRTISIEDRTRFRDELANVGVDSFAKMHVAVSILKDLQKGDAGLPTFNREPVDVNGALSLLAQWIEEKDPRLFFPRALNWFLRAAAYYTDQSILLYTANADSKIVEQGIPFTAKTVTVTFVRVSIYLDASLLTLRMALLLPKRKLMRRIACIAKPKLPVIKIKDAFITATQDIGQTDKIWDGTRIAPAVGWLMRIGLTKLLVPIALQWFVETAQAAVREAAGTELSSFAWLSPVNSFPQGVGAALSLATKFVGKQAAKRVVAIAKETYGTQLRNQLGAAGSRYVLRSLGYTVSGGWGIAISIGSAVVLPLVTDWLSNYTNGPVKDLFKPKPRKDWGGTVFAELVNVAYLNKSDEEVKLAVQRSTSGLLFHFTESVAVSSQVAVQTWFVADKLRSEAAAESKKVIRGEPISSCVARMREALAASRHVDTTISNLEVFIDDNSKLTNSLLDVSLNLDASLRFYMDELWEDANYNTRAAEKVDPKGQLPSLDVFISSPDAPYTGFFISSIPPKVVRVELEDAVDRRGFYNLGKVVGVDVETDLDSKLAVRELSDAVYTSRLGSYYEAIRSAYEAWISRILNRVVRLIKDIYTSNITFAIAETDLFWQQTQCGAATFLMLRHAPVNADSLPSRQLSELMVSYANRLASLKAMPPITSGILASQMESVARMQGLSSRGPRLMVASSTVLTNQFRQSQYQLFGNLNAARATLPAPTVHEEDVSTQRAIFAARRINRMVIEAEITRLSDSQNASVTEMTNNLARPDQDALFYHPFGSPLRLTPARGSLGDRVVSTRSLLKDLQERDAAYKDPSKTIDSSVNAWVMDNSKMSGLSQHPYVLAVVRSTVDALDNLHVHARLLDPNVAKVAPSPEELTNRVLDTDDDSISTWNNTLEELFNVDRILAAAALIRSNGVLSAGINLKHDRLPLWVAIASQLAAADGFVIQLYIRAQMDEQGSRSTNPQEWYTRLADAPQHMRLVEVLTSL